MQLDRRQIRNPYQRREIVSEKIVDSSFVTLAPHGRGFDPVRAVHRGVFFEEILLLHASGITLHGQRPSGEMRHQIGRDADVIIHHLPLGERGGGIEDLVKIRETKLAALYFDDGGSGHGSLAMESRASPPGWTGETPVPPPSCIVVSYSVPDS